MIALNKERKPLCLACADLDHLDYLPSGNTALTPRATRYSRLRAVVVQWSRTRKRYERQGILAEPKAIERAEGNASATPSAANASAHAGLATRQTSTANTSMPLPQGFGKTFPGVLRMIPAGSRNTPVANTAGGLVGRQRRNGSNPRQSGWLSRRARVYELR